MNFHNPDPVAIQALLARVKTIAIVGLSPKPERPSFGVARALQRFGYRVVPVRPATTSVLGETCYANLRDIPFPVDLVNVFRAPEFVPAVVDEAMAIGAPAIWLQDGVVHDEAALRAQSAGLTVVMDRCIYRDYMQWMS